MWGLLCKKIFLGMLIVKGIMGSYMTFQLYRPIKLMQKILLNENTTGDIPSKLWHLIVLRLKIISKLQFTCIYFLLVQCNEVRTYYCDCFVDFAQLPLQFSYVSSSFVCRCFRLFKELIVFVKMKMFIFFREKIYFVTLCGNSCSWGTYFIKVDGQLLSCSKYILD